MEPNSNNRRSIVTSLPSDYTDVQPKSYDPDFISDISNKMQVPDSIPVFNSDTEFNTRRSAGWGNREEDEIRRHHMNVPERILVAGGGHHIGTKPEIRSLNLDDSMPTGKYYEPVGLTTPPRTLTLEEQFPSFDHQEDENDDGEYEEKKIYTRIPNGRMGSGDALTPVSMTDSYMMSEQETNHLRTQLMVLSRKMHQLEKKQDAQATREKVLYSAAFGYLMLKFVFWFLRGK